MDTKTHIEHEHEHNEDLSCLEVINETVAGRDGIVNVCVELVCLSECIELGYSTSRHYSEKYIRQYMTIVLAFVFFNSLFELPVDFCQFFLCMSI